MSRFNAGDMVFATRDLLNDTNEETGESGIPGLLPDMLLAKAGTRGMVVNVGFLEDVPDAELYLVSFETGPSGALAEPIGCLAEEIGYQPPA